MDWPYLARGTSSFNENHLVWTDPPLLWPSSLATCLFVRYEKLNASQQQKYYAIPWRSFSSLVPVYRDTFFLRYLGNTSCCSVANDPFKQFRRFNNIQPRKKQQRQQGQNPLGYALELGKNMFLTSDDVPLVPRIDIMQAALAAKSIV